MLYCRCRSTPPEPPPLNSFFHIACVLCAASFAWRVHLVVSSCWRLSTTNVSASPTALLCHRRIVFVGVGYNSTTVVTQNTGRDLSVEPVVVRNTRRLFSRRNNQFISGLASPVFPSQMTPRVSLDVISIVARCVFWKLRPPNLASSRGRPPRRFRAAPS